MSLRYVALLSCGGAPTVCLATGLVAFFPVLRSPVGSGWADSCGFYSPIWFSTFAMGSPLRGRGWFHPQSERRLGVFLFLFWAVLRVATALRDLVTIRVRCVGWFPLVRVLRLSVVLSPLPFWMGFEPLSEATGAFPSGPRWGQESYSILGSLQCSSLLDVMVTCPPPCLLLTDYSCP